MKKVKFTTMIYEELVLKIKIQALKEGKSVSDILNELIENYLKKMGAA